MPAYRPRVVDHELAGMMRAIGGVLIEGPKACGKSETAKQVARTIYEFDKDDAARGAVALSPESLFTGEPPILFDEWQLEPSIWNQVRRQVDERHSRGDFLLTGSARPREDTSRHSGAGRIGVLQMRPMSLFESGHSNGEVSFAALLNGERQPGLGTHLSFDALLDRIVIGGWPEIIDHDEQDARVWLRGYLDQIVETDMPLMGHRRNPRNLRRLFASLARNVGQAVKLTELARDVGGEAGPITHETITGYLDTLERLRLTEDSPAWRPHMRSKTPMRTAEVRYFIDPSLGPAALGIGTSELRSDPLATGFHFEALAVRDLRIFAQAHHGRVESWRDKNGNEVDAIVSINDNKWAAFEIKLNPRHVEQAATSLLRFTANVDKGRHGEPAALGVITSTGAAGRRDDGVHVIPIGCLGP
ncbi:MAG: ATP-binding protein [Nocardioidaceae bacterium]